MKNSAEMAFRKAGIPLELNVRATRFDTVAQRIIGLHQNPVVRGELDLRTVR
jgi:hypothetical protein